MDLTKSQAQTIRDALHAVSVLVPDDHHWTDRERRLWERADAILSGDENPGPASYCFGCQGTGLHSEVGPMPCSVCGGLGRL